jgi:hypothetical protein
VATEEEHVKKRKGGIYVVDGEEGRRQTLSLN